MNNAGPVVTCEFCPRFPWLNIPRPWPSLVQHPARGVFFPTFFHTQYLLRFDGVGGYEFKPMSDIGVAEQFGS